MTKRLKKDIYRALGEYVINENPRLLNEEQLKIVEEHKTVLTKLYKKTQKEKRKRKVKKFVKEIPEYILSFISELMYWIVIPFDYIGNKADDLRVSYGNSHSYVGFSKAQKELNDYAYNKILPHLEEKETEDMTEVHQHFLKDKDITKNIKKIGRKNND